LINGLSSIFHIAHTAYQLSNFFFVMRWITEDDFISSIMSSGQCKEKTFTTRKLVPLFIESKDSPS
jgi:hypothetical protein